jgi:hydrogenase-4 component F
MILVLLLAAPLAGSVLSAVARRRAEMESINLASFAATFLLSLILAAKVLSAGTVSLWNGFLYADSLSALVVLLSSSVALVCGVYAVGYLRDDERSGALDEEDGTRDTAASLRRYYALTPLLVSSMFLVALANNLGVMWAAIELTTLASVFLVTFYGKVTSLEAAWKYVIIGGVGLSMALFGTIITYYAGHRLPGSEGLAGLNWSVLAQQAGQLDRMSMRLAFVLVLLGYGTKAGLAPMHTWKPDAYSEAPVPTAAILSTALLNCAVYGLVRYYILTSRCLGSDYPGRLLLLLGILSMGVAVPFLLVQKNFRRLLAYSTIDQAGIMITALGIGGKAAALALMLHMTFHTAAKVLLFLCAGNIYQRFGTDLFHKIKGGVISAMPLTGVAFFIGMLAIVGLPPFGLFQSEFLMIGAAFAGNHGTAAALFILFGAGVFAGVVLHLNRLVLGAAGESPKPGNPWCDSAVLASAVMTVMTGFWLPGPLMGLIQGAARVVTGD